MTSEAMKKWLADQEDFESRLRVTHITEHRAGRGDALGYRVCQECRTARRQHVSESETRN
jgi:hypothetical protein